MTLDDLKRLLITSGAIKLNGHYQIPEPSLIVLLTNINIISKPI